MFDLNWMEIGRILVLGVMAYIILIIMLRVAGKRSLAQLNAFDLVITVSIGSVFSTIMLDNKVSIFDGMAALFVLVALQWLFSFSIKKSDTFDTIVSADPALLFYNGTFFYKTMEKERIRKDEVIQSVRMEGNLTMDEVQVVILEANGELSILPKSEHTQEDTITNIKN